MGFRDGWLLRFVLAVMMRSMGCDEGGSKLFVGVFKVVEMCLSRAVEARFTWKVVSGQRETGKSGDTNLGRVQLKNIGCADAR